MECKTYSEGTKESSMRAFYFQVSKNYKILHPARHLLVSFEIAREKRAHKLTYVPLSWELYCLNKLRIQMKHEFNASNVDMYQNCELLAKGKA